MYSYLVGFRCFDYKYGCLCTHDIDQKVKDNFKKKYGIEYNSYCYFDYYVADNEEDLKLMIKEHMGELLGNLYANYEIICVNSID